MEIDNISDSESYSSMPPLESVTDLREHSHSPSHTSHSQTTHWTNLPNDAACLDAPSPTLFDLDPTGPQFVAEQFIYFVVIDTVVSECRSRILG